MSSNNAAILRFSYNFSHFLCSGKRRMVPLLVHQRIWTWLSVCSIGNQGKCWKFLYGIVTIGLCTGFFSEVIGSATYIIKYLSTDPIGSLHALFQMSSQTALSYVVINGFISRHKILIIFEQLTDLYTKCTEWFSLLNC